MLGDQALGRRRAAVMGGRRTLAMRVSVMGRGEEGGGFWEVGGVVVVVEVGLLLCVVLSS